MGVLCAMASADFIDWFFHSKNTSVRQKREAVGGTSSPNLDKGSPLSAAADDWSSDTKLLIALFLKGLDTLQVPPSSETKCQAKHLHEGRNVAQQSASPYLSVLVLSAHEHELTA